MLYFIITILIATIGLFVYSGFRIKSKLIKIANGTLTKEDLKEIEVISKYYEIPLIEAAKIHYGKAIITEEMIKRLERPYRELYEKCKNFSTNKQEKISRYLSSNNQDNYLEAINFILIAEESVDIALKSKNKDVAEGRKKLALEMQEKIQKKTP
ncbi:Uncharacterised protein [Campylobacter lari]|nr:hypothetical protein [Campylobacter lari]VEJ06771.1 Uncharacterised protein [Campylobacter lari]